MHIAIVDDDMPLCAELERNITEICRSENLRCEIAVYYSGEAVCDDLQQQTAFDLIFLDIELNALNGVHVGKYLRETLNDHRTQIVYISAKQDYAMQLFQVQPLDFLVKPITSAQLSRCLKRYHTLFPFEAVLEWKSGGTVSRLPYDQILWLESKDKKICVMTDSGTISFTGKLSDFEPQMMLWIHKSFIVNRQYIAQYRRDV